MRTIILLITLCQIFSEEATIAKSEVDQLNSDATELEHAAETQRKEERFNTLAKAFALRQKAKAIEKPASVSDQTTAHKKAASLSKIADDYTEAKRKAGRLVIEAAVTVAKSLDLANVPLPFPGSDLKTSEQIACNTVLLENKLRNNIKVLLDNRDKSEKQGKPSNGIEGSIAYAVDAYLTAAISDKRLAEWRKDNLK